MKRNAAGGSLLYGEQDVRAGLHSERAASHTHTHTQNTTDGRPTPTAVQQAAFLPMPVRPRNGNRAPATPPIWPIYSHQVMISERFQDGVTREIERG